MPLPAVPAASEGSSAPTPLCSLEGLEPPPPALPAELPEDAPPVVPPTGQPWFMSAYPAAVTEDDLPTVPEEAPWLGGVPLREEEMELPSRGDEEMGPRQISTQPSDLSSGPPSTMPESADTGSAIAQDEENAFPSEAIIEPVRADGLAGKPVLAGWLLVKRKGASPTIARPLVGTIVRRLCWHRRLFELTDEHVAYWSSASSRAAGCPPRRLFQLAPPEGEKHGCIAIAWAREVLFSFPDVARKDNRRGLLCLCTPSAQDATRWATAITEAAMIKLEEAKAQRSPVSSTQAEPTENSCTSWRSLRTSSSMHCQALH